jgi:membrane protein required for colicin V production
MSGLDIMVLLLIGGLALMGFLRGFVAEALSVGAFLFAIVVVRLFHAPVTGLLGALIGTESGGAVLALALLFAIPYALGRLAAARIGAASRRSALGPVDRVLGFGFGAVKGLLIATLLFLGFVLVHDLWSGGEARRPAWLRESRTYPLLNASGRAMSSWMEERRKGVVETPDPADDAQEDEPGRP